MASPLEHFRKNQKLYMAVLVVISLVTFVLIPGSGSLQEVRSALSSQKNQTLVSWKGGKLSIRELERMRVSQQLTYRIFEKIAGEVVKAGGTPKVPGFFSSVQGMSIGIQPPPNPDVMPMPQVYESVAELYLLAESAKKRGIVVDDLAVDNFIKKFVDGKISGPRFEEITKEIAGPELSRFEIYSFLKAEIARQILVQLGGAGITVPASAQPLVTPGKSWENFQRFQQRAKIEAYPIFVDDLVSKVTAKPSEQELRNIYERGKNFFRPADSAEPGFYQGYKTNIEYVTISNDTFLKQAEAAITEEVLKAEYDKRVQDQGAYRVPVEETKPADPIPTAEPTKKEEPKKEEPKKEDSKKDDEPKKDESKNDGPMKDDTPQGESKPEPQKNTPSTDEEKPKVAPEKKKADKKKADSKKADTKKADSKAKNTPTTPESEPKSAPEVKPETNAKPTSSEPAAPGQAEPKPNSDASSVLQLDGIDGNRNKVRLVAFQEEKPTGDTAKAPETSPKPPTLEAPIEPSTTPAANGTTEAKAETKPASDSKAGNPGTASTTESKPAEKPMRTKTLDEVRDELRRELAQRPAAEKRDAAQKAVREAMDKYYSDLQFYNTRNPDDKEAVEPERPSLSKLADEHGFTYSKTGMVDAYQVQDLSIGRSFVGSFQRPVGIADAIFDPRVNKFLPIEAMGLEGANFVSYLLWKIEDTEARVPAFEECREQVEKAWKISQAKQLAIDKATELASSINANSDTDPWTVVLEENLRGLVIKPPMFTWMQPAFRPGEAATLSNIEGIVNAGGAIMEKVFESPVGKATFAFDDRQKKCFVIRVVERAPNDEELQQKFQSSPRNEATDSLAFQQAREVAAGWFQSLQNSVGVDFSNLRELK